MIEVAALALAGLLRAGAPAVPDIDLWPSRAQPAASAAFYGADERAVSTWRDGTRRTLEPLPLALAAAWLDVGRPVVTRCVKLNNPWCIKRARWPGEIGGDEEGHTAFSSTEAGADAAATLLRSYYVAYGRRSALDIVRRWAPAECRIGLAGLPAMFAVGGLANTLRARYLAGRSGTGTVQPVVTRGRGGVRVAAKGGGRVRVSVVPPIAMPSFRVPDLTPGGGEGARARTASRPPAPTTSPLPRVSAASPSAERARFQQRVRRSQVAARTHRAAAESRAREAAAKLPAGTPRVAATPPPRVRIAALSSPIPPVFGGCGSEEGRIRNYAAAISRALDVSSSDDLKLFDESGQPTVNLLPVMVAMSAVELGFLHASPTLAEGAVERLKARLAEAAARDAAARDAATPRVDQNLMDTTGQ